MKIDGCEIVKELSRGPISTVYLGRQTALERPVLIKLLNAQWQQEKDLVGRFRREAIICARLKHSNIVNIFNVGTEPENLYLIMEFLEGEDLGLFIRKYHPLPPEIILFIAKEILKGLVYAHGKGVLHRDIKPSNIMISREGAVKITDFGLATAEALPKLTLQGGTVGTPAYMSPEQASGMALDARSDIFSLGATLYELASDVSPFLSDSFAACIQKVIAENPPPLTETRPDIPMAFSKLLEKMLNKSAENRPITVDAILALPLFQAQKTTPEKLVSFIEAPAEYVAAQPPHLKPQNLETPNPVQRLSQKRTRFFPFLIVLVLVAASLSFYFLLPAKDPVQQEAGPLSVIPADTSRHLSKDLLIISRDKKPVSEMVVKMPDSSQQEISSNNESQHQQAKLSENSGKASLQDAEKQVAGNTNPEGNLTRDGTLFIQTTPRTEIWLEGRRMGLTPQSTPFILAPGNYQLELVKPNYQGYQQQITMQTGKAETLIVTLEPLPGTLDLRVAPWGYIYINGEYLGTTPLKKPLLLPAGKHRLRLTNPNFATWQDSIEILPRQNLPLTIPLEKK